MKYFRARGGCIRRRLQGQVVYFHLIFECAHYPLTATVRRWKPDDPDSPALDKVARRLHLVNDMETSIVALYLELQGWKHD